MAEKYQNKYRIQTARASWWNYGWNGAYFVTICTKNRLHYFGKVVNGNMQLSNIGKMADACWLAIPEHFPFVKLGNHDHIIRNERSYHAISHYITNNPQKWQEDRFYAS